MTERLINESILDRQSVHLTEWSINGSILDRVSVPFDRKVD